MPVCNSLSIARRLQQSMGMCWAVCWLGGLVTPAIADDGSREFIAQCRAATAYLDRGVIGSGTATCVHPDGLFLTNAHVVQGLGFGDLVQLTIAEVDASIHDVQAAVVSLDAESDLALLKVKSDRPFTAIDLGAVAGITELKKVTFFGYPYGSLLAQDGRVPEVTVSQGAISAVRREQSDVRLVQIDGGVGPGHSGGPVVDDQGRLLALLVGQIRGTSFTFAIPVNTIRDFLQRPGLLPTFPRWSFADRRMEQAVRVECIAFDPASQPDAVSLRISDDATPHGERLALVRDGNAFQCLVCPASAGADDECVLFVWEAGQDRPTFHRLASNALQVDGAQRSLLELRSLRRSGEDYVIFDNSGRKSIGTVEGLPALGQSSKPPFEPARTVRMDIYWLGHPLRQLAWELEATRNGKPLSSADGLLELAETPAALNPERWSRFETDEQKYIEAVNESGSHRKSALTQSEIAAWEQTVAAAPVKWTAVTFARAETGSKTDFQQQPDGSYYIVGPDDTLETAELALVIPTELERVTAVRLDLIPDDRTKGKSPSRHKTGSCFINEIHVSDPASNPPRRLPLGRVTADHERVEPNLSRLAINAADGRTATGWSAYPKNRSPHEFVLELQTPWTVPASRELLFTVMQHYAPGYTLARFKVSVTDAQAPVLADRLPEPVQNVLEVPTAERTADGWKTLVKYFEESVPDPDTLAGPNGEPLHRPSLPWDAFADRNDPFVPCPDVISLDVWIEDRSNLHIDRYGLWWEHKTGFKPGVKEQQGRRIDIDGVPWYPRWNTSAELKDADESSRFALPLGPGTWKVELDDFINEHGKFEVEGRNVTIKNAFQETIVQFHDQARNASRYKLRLVRDR